MRQFIHFARTFCNEGDEKEANGKCPYSDLRREVQSENGWYTSLATYTDEPSERILARSVILGGLIIFTTYTPLNDVCSIFGGSDLYAINYDTGTAADEGVFSSYDEFGQLIVDESGDTVDINEDEIQKSIDIGVGMPTGPALSKGETVTAFVQKGSGQIVRIKTEFEGGTSNSGAASWREKIKDGGTVEIEQIYKRIVQ